MKTTTDKLVSITMANQNFSKVAKMVEENGEVVILKNNKPEFVLSKFDQEYAFDKEDVLELVARRILSKHINAFVELGK